MRVLLALLLLASGSVAALASCTPDVASTGTGGHGGASTVDASSSGSTGSGSMSGSTGSVASTSGSTSTGNVTTTSVASSTSTVGSSTAVSSGSAMPIWGPCGTVTDAFTNGGMWTTIGGISFGGGQAHMQGSGTMTLTSTVPTEECFVSFRLVSAQFAGDATLELRVNGTVDAYAMSDGNEAEGGLTPGSSSQIGNNDPDGLGVAFYGGDVWFLVKNGSTWTSIGSTNASLGSSSVQIVATGPGALKFDLDDFGDPIPFSALN